jgi:hypothetical protein
MNRTKKKGSRAGCLFDRLGLIQPKGPAQLIRGGGFAGKLLAKLLDPASFDYALLGTGIKGVGFGSDIQLEQRIVLAIFHFDGFASIHSGTGYELEARAHILKHNFAVVGVNAFFHHFSFGFRPAGRRLCDPYGQDAAEFSQAFDYNSCERFG